MFRVWFAALAMLSSGATFAAPVTYSCTIVDGKGQMGMYDAVDQVLIDQEAGLIDLRVARTMGTSNEVNWIFTSRIGYDGSEESMHMHTAQDGTIIASGYDAVGSYSFRFDGRYLGFGATYANPALAFTWECRR